MSNIYQKSVYLNNINTPIDLYVYEDQAISKFKELMVRASSNIYGFNTIWNNELKNKIGTVKRKKGFPGLNKEYFSREDLKHDFLEKYFKDIKNQLSINNIIDVLLIEELLKMFLGKDVIKGIPMVEHIFEPLMSYKLANVSLFDNLIGHDKDMGELNWAYSTSTFATILLNTYLYFSKREVFTGYIDAIKKVLKNIIQTGYNLNPVHEIICEEYINKLDHTIDVILDDIRSDMDFFLSGDSGIDFSSNIVACMSMRQAIFFADLDLANINDRWFVGVIPNLGSGAMTATILIRPFYNDDDPIDRQEALNAIKSVINKSQKESGKEELTDEDITIFDDNDRFSYTHHKEVFGFGIEVNTIKITDYLSYLSYLRESNR